VEQKKSEMLIDVGGGVGEHFARLARENSDKIYLVLDPQVELKYRK